MKYSLYIGCIVILCFSCRVSGPDVMFKTPKDFVSDDLGPGLKKEYIIRAGDRLNIYVFANNAAELIHISGLNYYDRVQSSFQYNVRENGIIKLPLIDTVVIEGFSIVEAEKFLEEEYAAFFRDPFIIIEVINRRVLVFNERGRGRVVKIENEKTNLIEILAKAGGIGRTGKAYRIKLIRENPKDPEKPLIKIVDFSTTDGLKDAGLIVQANDIIYVEPVIRIASEITTEISPFVGLISTVTGLITTYLLISEITK